MTYVIDVKHKNIQLLHDSLYPDRTNHVIENVCAC